MHELAWKAIFVLIILLPIGSLGNSLLLSSIYVPLCLISGSLSFVTYRRHRHSLRTTIIFLSVLVLGFYLILQLIPLPPALIDILSPTTGTAYQDTIWVVQSGAWMPLAIHAEATISSLLFIVAVGSLCLAISHLMAARDDFARILRYIVLAVAVWSLSTIVLTITLVLPDHLVAWQEMMTVARERMNLWAICLTPILLAGYAIHRPRITRLPFREKFREFLQAPAENPHLGEYLTILLVVVSTMASRNWQGIVLLFSAWVAFRLLTLSRSRSDKMAWQWLLRGTAVACLLGFTMLSNYLLEIYQKTPRNSSIVSPYVATWFHTWFGCGLGGHVELLQSEGIFACKFAADSTLGGVVELWIGLGVWGSALLVVMIIMLVKDASKGRFGHAKGMLDKLISAGIVSIVLFVISALYVPHLNWEVTFSGCWLVLLLMLSPRISQETASYSNSDKLYRSIFPVCLCGFVTASLILSVLFYARAHIDEKISDQVALLHSGNLNQDQLMGLNKAINRALRWVPFIESSNLPMLQGSLEYYQMNEIRTLALFERALLNRPLNPQLLMALTGTYGWLNRADTAKKLMSSEPFSNYRPDPFLERLITRLFNSEITETGLAVVQKTFDLCPEYAIKCLNLLYVNGWSHDDIQSFLPEKPSIWFSFGDMLYAQGEVDKAEEIYLKAVAMRSTDTHDEQAPYNRVAKYFVASGQLVKAQIVAEAGAEVFPKSGDMKRMVADIHSRLGNVDKAKQGYEQADVLDHEASQ